MAQKIYKYPLSKEQNRNKLLLENTEVKDQQHEMFAEGSCDDEPTEQEIIIFLRSMGWDSSGVEIFFDGMQSVWRWKSYIKK